MKSRLNYLTGAPGVYDAMDSSDQYLQNCGLEKSLLFLVQLRASQINGCAYCVDMHSKDLAACGETELRLYSLIVWRESPYYTDRERAALAWTESITKLSDGHALETLFQETRSHFSEKEMCDLTFAIATINAWNRLSIAARLVPGRNQPEKTAKSM